MHIFINLNAGEEPNKININLENFIIFQKVKNSSNLFTVFDRKRNEIKQIYTWDGNHFLDFQRRKFENLIRGFSGEILRVGSGPMMPWAFLWTLQNGTQLVGSGAYHEYLRMISELDNITLKWVDVLFQEGLLWGTLYENGSSTGLTKLVMEHQVDVATAMYCGVRLHRHLDCSTPIEYDGFAALLLKPKPLPSWLGIISPFDMTTWITILSTIITTTAILGSCMKYVIKLEKVDWTIHFLDALHPMCGRNMALPGLNAAHLGRE